MTTARSVLIALVLSVSVASGQSSIPSPEAFFGFAPGVKPVRYDDAVRYCRLLASQSPRMRMVEMGESYEHRTLFYLIAGSPERLRSLDDIRARHNRLADPRTLRPGEEESIITEDPAVVWIGYGIHGDELSSVDAAMHVAYRLAAATEDTVILKNLIVCLEPIENPDGRERYLSQLQQWSGSISTGDVQSMQHNGSWPYGRGNHYLFDVNRDWFTLECRESQARVPAVAGWNPQVIIDAHEMGALDTYLFSPARDPINPNIGEPARHWSGVFAADQAKAFDAHGWSYYTREWSDDWFPGYGSSWGSYVGAVGILYEQAGTDGSFVRRPGGTTMSYREAVEHHVVSSLANLTTAAAHRKELLHEFVASRRSALEPRKGEPRAFYLLPRANPTRVGSLVERLMKQGIEVRTTTQETKVRALHDATGGEAMTRLLPAGTYAVSMAQPLSRLAKAILEFDPRMTTAFLEEERKTLQKEKDSKLYDVTAWSLPLAFGVEAYWSSDDPASSFTPVTTVVRPQGKVVNPRPAYGFLIDAGDDVSIDALVGLFRRDYQVRAARETCVVEGHSFSRGSLLLRLNENPKTLVDSIISVAASAGVTVVGVNTALSSKGPDLGGNDFVLLRNPRIAIPAGPGVSMTGFGALWHLLDFRLGMKVTLLPASQLATADLRPYNVLLLPSAGEPQAYQRLFGKGGIARLKEWCEGGGTVVALDEAAAFLADTATGASAVRLRHQVLKDLDLYAKGLEWERAAAAPVVDSLRLWGNVPVVKDTAKGAKAGPPNEKELALSDERARLFMPRGSILRVNLDPDHWLSFGAGDYVGALVYTADAFLSRDPVRTAARFADEDHLRLSGLLWPEARERWAGTAYATREAKGKGQIVLFAGEPNFRGVFRGTERLLLNALLWGPGFGTAAPLEW
jgi:hypothetical protein